MSPFKRDVGPDAGFSVYFQDFVSETMVAHSEKDGLAVYFPQRNRPPANLPKDPTDVKAMLEVRVKAERCAIGGYTAICNCTAGKDHRAYDLALATLNEEIEHQPWLSEFLGEGPSGHFRQQGTGFQQNSPCLGKLLHE